MALEQSSRDLGRAKNALQDYLVKRLLLPKVYFDVSWNGATADVLAVDRAGAGDVHVARIASGLQPHFTPHDITESVFVSDNVENGVGNFLDNFMNPEDGHYRYVLFLVRGSKLKEFRLSSKLRDRAMTDDGVGRIGVLFVDLEEEKATMNVVMKPERFRSNPEMARLSERFVAEHPANWEIRDEPSVVG